MWSRRVLLLGHGTQVMDGVDDLVFFLQDAEIGCGVAANNDPLSPQSDVASLFWDNADLDLTSSEHHGINALLGEKTKADGQSE